MNALRKYTTTGFLKIRFLLISGILLLFLSCQPAMEQADISTDKYSTKFENVEAFERILDSAKVKGAILIYDLAKDTYYSNDFDWIKQGHLPASTFKIPNSIIALETGVVNSDSTLFKWDGNDRNMKIWEQDLVFSQAFHYSCVPCYQEVARKIGVEQMIEYLDKLNYGNMEVDSASIDLFWLEGESKINQLEQIDFLKQLYLSELQVSDRTEEIIKRMMIIEEKPGYRLSGKTGWSIRNGNNNGWFVGYMETKENTWLFASNIEPEENFNLKMFPMIRKQITIKAFKTLGIIDSEME